VGGTFPKALLLLCCLSFALVACSREPPNKPDRVHKRAAQGRTVTTGGGDLATARKAHRKLHIEDAELQRGQGGDEILLVVEVEHPGFFPDCFLMDARSREAAHGRGVYDRRAVECRWPAERSTETVQMGSAYVIVYHEDPGRKVANPRETPYFAVCSEAGTMHSDEVHVDGTPAASP
jgi:hypothetical protein